MKKILSLLLSGALIVTMLGLPVKAEEVIYPKVYHVYTTDDEFMNDEWYAVQRGVYLLSGSCNIARAGGTYVNVIGSTKAVQDCDKVQLKLYVERSTSSSSGFTTYKSYSYSANNAHQLTKEILSIPVERGYYYRVRGVHSVTEGSKTETTSSLTNPLSFI